MGQSAGFDMIQEIRQKLSGTNTTQRHLPFRSWCEHYVAGKMPNLPHKRGSSDHDLPETQMDCFITNRKTGSELMTVLNFLD